MSTHTHARAHLLSARATQPPVTCVTRCKKEPPRGSSNPSRCCRGPRVQEGLAFEQHQPQGQHYTRLAYLVESPVSRNTAAVYCCGRSPLPCSGAPARRLVKLARPAKPTERLAIGSKTYPLWGAPSMTMFTMVHSRVTWAHFVPGGL